MASGMPRLQAFKTIKYLLQHGKPGGRQSATEALADFQGAEANALVQKAVNDKDPEVQARALSQLRQRGTAGALPLLIERLDSPHEAVREAARGSLTEFSFSRYLAGFETLDDEVRESTGRLVKKVDPKSGELLQAELTSKVRSRRLRGLAMAAAMDMAAELQETLIELLQDEDHMVRQEAVHLLGTQNNATARKAIEQALEDSSLMVREVAAAALEELNAEGGAPAPPANEDTGADHA